MTPYEIDILLWYHSRCEDHPDLMRSPPVWRETINSFLDNGLLVMRTERSAKYPMCYAPTERLHAYVYSICAVALPVNQWATIYPANGPQGLRYGVTAK